MVGGGPCPPQAPCRIATVQLYTCGGVVNRHACRGVYDRLYSKCYCHNADSSGQGLGSGITTTPVQDMKRTGSIVIVTDASGKRRYHPCTHDIVPERYQCCNDMGFSYVIVRQCRISDVSILYLPCSLAVHYIIVFSSSKQHVLIHTKYMYSNSIKDWAQSLYKLQCLSKATSSCPTTDLLSTKQHGVSQQCRAGTSLEVPVTE